jgi:hypothetical protein
MRTILPLTIVCLVVGLAFDDCGSGPTNPGVPPGGAPDCVHYYTCSTGPDFGCNPDAPIDFCGLNNAGSCIDRGCTPQPGQVAPPPSGGGIKITFNTASPQGGALGIQKYDHNNRTPVGNKQYVKIPPGRSADKIAKDFCSLSNFLGIYCTASGNVASFYNAQLDIYYDTNDLSQHDDIGFP